MGLGQGQRARYGVRVQCEERGGLLKVTTQGGEGLLRMQRVGGKLWD
jgi:hypothetical protein